MSAFLIERYFSEDLTHNHSDVKSRSHYLRLEYELSGAGSQVDKLAATMLISIWWYIHAAPAGRVTPYAGQEPYDGRTESRTVSEHSNVTLWPDQCSVGDKLRFRHHINFITMIFKGLLVLACIHFGSCLEIELGRDSNVYPLFLNPFDVTHWKCLGWTV